MSFFESSYILDSRAIFLLILLNSIDNTVLQFFSPADFFFCFELSFSAGDDSGSSGASGGGTDSAASFPAGVTSAPETCAGAEAGSGVSAAVGGGEGDWVPSRAGVAILV